MMHMVVLLKYQIVIFASNCTDARGEIMRNSVFLSFIFSLLVIIHDLISRTQASTQARASAEKSTSQVNYSWVSSAYIWYISLWDRIIAPRGRVYIQKMMGPKTDPCGTPKTSCDREERTLWMDTHCVRSLRYVLNMRNTDPDSPTCSFRKWSRISWSTVSKAADRSSNTRKTCSFLPTPSWHHYVLSRVQSPYYGHFCMRIAFYPVGYFSPSALVVGLLQLFQLPLTEIINSKLAESSKNHLDWESTSSRGVWL